MTSSTHSSSTLPTSYDPNDHHIEILLDDMNSIHATDSSEAHTSATRTRRACLYLKSNLDELLLFIPACFGIGSVIFVLVQLCRAWVQLGTGRMRPGIVVRICLRGGERRYKVLDTLYARWDEHTVPLEADEHLAFELLYWRSKLGGRGRGQHLSIKNNWPLRLGLRSSLLYPIPLMLFAVLMKTLPKCPRKFNRFKNFSIDALHKLPALFCQEIHSSKLFA